MNPSELDLVLLRLRTTAPAAPSALAGNVLSVLGPPAQQVRTIFLGGLCACLAGVILSTAITLEVARKNVAPTPPQLGLFSEGIVPFASL